jgi:hypothetical protein
LAASWPILDNPEGERTCRALESRAAASVPSFAVDMELHAWRRQMLLLLILAAPPARACCKAAFIAHYNLSRTALATNTTGRTLDEARRAHVSAAMRLARQLNEPAALRLEFGVRNGAMLNHMAALEHGGSPLRWDGFDSFKGLPKSTANAARLGWGGGKYSVSGRLPTVPPHVHLHAGWFNETLPQFLDATPGAVAFAHLDADIYTSTINVLDALATRCRLREGSVLAFDEIFGPRRIEREELRALQEASRAHGLRWRFVTYLNHPRTLFGRAAVTITRDPPCVGRPLAGGG